MSNKFLEIGSEPDWSSDRAIAFDLDQKVLVGVGARNRKRVFIPRSQTRVQGGVTFVSEWILEKKVEELITEGFHRGAAEQAVRHIAKHQGRTVEEAGPQQQAAISLPGLTEWFTAAAENLRTPHVEFPLNGGVVSFARKGNRAKVPGAIELTNGYQWGDPSRQWYGTVSPDGDYSPAGRVSDELIDLVKEFDADPGAFVSKAQKNAGNCCFCRHELTTEASRNAGYGPTCAKNYRLPY